MADEQLQRLQAALADRYPIERELGSGGMAKLYLAEDVKQKRNAGRSGSDGAAESAEEEVTVSRRLNVPRAP
ncbi:MAG: hypothetical protein IH965_11575 [Gemmatimonadetes bacterium]|nr:hypothetical protein [Gemmatimonadota bacterium]